MNRRSFLMLSALAAATVGGIYWRRHSYPSNAASAPRAGRNVLRLGYPAEVQNLDPIKSVFDADILVQGMMYARLLRANADRTEVGPGLAHSWDISPDGKTYIFHLREAGFSDGTPITAEDVAFSWSRMRFQKDSAYSAPFQLLETIEATDASTVVMKLGRRFTPFLTLTEIWNTGIVPKAAVLKMGEDTFARTPITSGPFKLADWRPGDRVVLTRNEHYYRTGKPYLDALEFCYVPDDNTRVAMLEAGELDVCLQVPALRLAELHAAGFRANPEPSTVTYDMLINHAQAPFDDLRFRQAVSYGIDRKVINSAVTFGTGRPASSLISPNLDYFDTELPVIERDVARAKSLLAQAGKTGTTFELLQNAGAEHEEKAAVLIQAQLAEIGLTVNIVKIDSTQAWTRLVDGDYQAELNWWYADTRDPDNALRWCVWGKGENKSFYTRYNNEEVNNLIDQASAEPDASVRAALYRRIQRITVAEVAQIALYHPSRLNAYSPAIQDLILNVSFQFSSIDETRMTRTDARAP